MQLFIIPNLLMTLSFSFCQEITADIIFLFITVLQYSYPNYVKQYDFSGMLYFV